MNNQVTINEDENQLPDTKNHGQGVEEQRAVAQVKAAMFVAKTYPRNEMLSFSKIIEACKRKSFAESSMYAYPKGGKLVTGPSIRMAETLARYWGNIDYGIQVLSQDTLKGVSEVMAYAWDIENNVRQTRTFTVAHKRKARGKFEKLDDPRDIYEHEANLGARRVRACILGLIPTDIIEEAQNACDLTMRGDNDMPMKEKIRNMVKRFEEVGVPQGMLEEHLGHSVDGIIPVRLAELGKIYNSIKNGIATKEQFFGKVDASVDDAKKLTEELNNKKKDVAEEVTEDVIDPDCPI